MGAPGPRSGLTRLRTTRTSGQRDLSVTELALQGPHQGQILANHCQIWQLNPFSGVPILNPSPEQPFSATADVCQYVALHFQEPGVCYHQNPPPVVPMVSSTRLAYTRSQLDLPEGSSPALLLPPDPLHGVGEHLPGV